MALGNEKKNCCIMDFRISLCMHSNWRKKYLFRFSDRQREWKVEGGRSKREILYVKRFHITCNARRLSVKYTFQSLRPYIKCQELLNYTRSSTQSEHFFSSTSFLCFSTDFSYINLNFM